MKKYITMVLATLALGGCFVVVQPRPAPPPRFYYRSYHHRHWCDWCWAYHYGPCH
jgi:hypothetical protein